MFFLLVHNKKLIKYLYIILFYNIFINMNILNILKFAVSKPKIPSIIYSHKARYTFEERSKDADYIYNVLKKIPLILEKDELSKLPEIEVSNYILPECTTISEFMVFLRKTCFKLNYREHMFIFVSNCNYVPELNEQIGNLYEKYKDNDGFIYCKYSSK